jgi:hypothetical protein
VNRPDVLYHGSSVLVPVLRPINGAIYAAHDRLIAIPFALKIRCDQRGCTSWRLHMESPEPTISIELGTLDIDGVGYVYRLAIEGFEPAGNWEWVSRAPVTPLGCDVIRTGDYAQWVI